MSFVKNHCVAIMMRYSTSRTCQNVSKVLLHKFARLCRLEFEYLDVHQPNKRSNIRNNAITLILLLIKNINENIYGSYVH